MIEGMIELTEPQIWTLIAVFAASMFGMLRMVTKSFADLLRAEIGGVRSEIGGLRTEMIAKFEAQNVKLDHLDRDVQALVRRVFPEYPDAG